MTGNASRQKRKVGKASLAELSPSSKKVKASPKVANTSSRKHTIDFFDAEAIIKSKTKSAQETSNRTIDEESGSATSDSDNDSDDDVTAALLKGFESSDDESVDQEAHQRALITTAPTPKLPNEVETRRKINSVKSKSEEPGTVFLGHIPHGFYEIEMRAYFSQFGTITRLKLARNKVTGKPKHYAFIEFASSAVATIVAETMDNYLLFNHILKCKAVPAEQCQEKMWNGANRRWKVAPVTKIRRNKNDSKKSLEDWKNLEQAELQKREAKQKKWKEMGIDYTFNVVPTQQQKVTTIEMSTATLAITDGEKTNASGTAVKTNQEEEVAESKAKKVKGKGKGKAKK